MTPMSPAASRPRLPRGPRAVVLATVVLTLLLFVAVPVTAHPFVRGGGEVPVDSVATITLDLAHGCGSEGEQVGQDTLEVALEVPPWLRVLEVAGHPAYQHDLEAVGGRTEVVTWRLVGTAEPAPAFELDVVATGTVGQTRYLAVFQGCEDRSHRWIGTPDAPADDPAIGVRLTPADPDRPAPPETPESPTEEVPADMGADGSEGSDGDGSTADPEPADPEAAGEVAPSDGGGAAETGGGPWSSLRWPGLLVVGLVGLVVLVLAGRGRGRADRSTSS